MKKVKLIIAGVAMLGLVSSSSVYADAFAPGEGLYIGAFMGHSAGHVNAKVKTNNDGNASNTSADSITTEIVDGGVGLEGIEGGGYIGYGYKMGSLYIGFEADFAGGGAEFKITSDGDVQFTRNEDEDGANVADSTYRQIDVETKWTSGGGARIGYYVSPTTLLSIKGGIAASEFEAALGSITETYYAGGPRLGAAIESALVDVDPNLSVRLAWDYTDYMTAPVSGIGTVTDGAGGADAEVSGAMYNAHIGLQYSFFDVNSLF